MTSKIFHGSRQRMMHAAQEVLKEMKMRKASVDTQNSYIQATRGWGFMRSGQEVEITMYADENRVEVAVNAESKVKALDFGTSEYLEEEFLLRLNDRLN
ncbi:MAG: DUF1499 domain-containing protein [Flavobacteriales bacterium]